MPAAAGERPVAGAHDRDPDVGEARDGLEMALPAREEDLGNPCRNSENASTR